MSLKKRIQLNLNIDMIIQNKKRVELNPKLSSAAVNIKMMI